MRTLVLLFALILHGCAPYKIKTQEFYEQRPMGRGEIIPFPKEEQGPELYARRKQALDHWLYHVIPRHRCQIRFWDLGHWTTWLFLGNDDDGLFGEEPSANYWLEQENNTTKALYWTGRNPLHNLCFYGIGRAYTDTSEFVLLSLSEPKKEFLKYKPVGETVFAGDGGSSFFLGFHGGLPFISLRLNHFRQTAFYVGWRERCNFGFKLRPFKKLPEVTKDEGEKLS